MEIVIAIAAALSVFGITILPTDGEDDQEESPRLDEPENELEDNDNDEDDLDEPGEDRRFLLSQMNDDIVEFTENFEPGRDTLTIVLPDHVNELFLDRSAEDEDSFILEFYSGDDILSDANIFEGLFRGHERLPTEDIFIELNGVGIDYDLTENGSIHLRL